MGAGATAVRCKRPTSLRHKNVRRLRQTNPRPLNGARQLLHCTVEGMVIRERDRPKPLVFWNASQVQPTDSRRLDVTVVRCDRHTEAPFEQAMNETDTLDVCATAENTKCQRFFSPIDDGLKQTWTGTCWMNPPYGRAIGQWMRKAYESAQAGALVVTLVPARTDTEWWHEWASKGEVRFIRGRVRFGSPLTTCARVSRLVSA